MGAVIAHLRCYDTKKAGFFPDGLTIPLKRPHYHMVSLCLKPLIYPPRLDVMPMREARRNRYKVNKMSEVDWESVKTKVDSCLEGDIDSVIPGDVRSLAAMLIETGDNNVDNRSALANSIKAMLKDFPSGKAVWRRGNQGLLPAAAMVVVDAACEEIRAAAYDFFEATAQYSQPLIRKHGKSKGSPVYTDAADYANSLAKKARGTARDLFKAEEWDGTLDGLSACAEYDYVEEEE